MTPKPLKKVKTHNLLPGMFVVDLNAGWLGHPFVRSKFRVDADDIQLIIEAGIKEVTIDPERGLDADAPALAAVETAASIELQQLANQPILETDGPSQETNREKALQAVNLAVSAVRTLMTQVHSGKSPQFAALNDVAQQLVHEVITNPATAAIVFRLQQTCEYTFAHSLRMAVLAVACAHRLGLSAEQCQRIAIGGLIHDIGKMRVEQTILQKPGKLDASEMEHMRQHVDLGESLIDQYQLPQEAIQVLKEHHERFDGNGYPRRLKGNEISLIGRIAAVADVFDAISSDRPYHLGLPPAAAIRKIFEWSKYHFDPLVCAEFIRAVGVYPVGSLVRLSNRRLAVVVEHVHSVPLKPKVLVVFDLHQKKTLPQPIEINLSTRAGLEIESFESASDWGIDPMAYL